MKKQIFKRRLKLAFCAIYVLAALWWVNSTGSAGDILPILAFALPIGGLLGIFAMSFRLKNAFLRFSAMGSLRIGNADEFPHLNRSEWERLTREWHELGFETRVDRAGNMDNPAYGQTFSRTLEHPSLGAIAEISQSFMPTQSGEITLSVASLWGEREPVLQMAQQLERAAASVAPLAAPVQSDDAATFQKLPDEMGLWLLITHNRAVNKFWSLMRQKRVLSRRIEGEIAPLELWRLHLEQREDVEARLKLRHQIGDLDRLLEAHGLILSAQLHQRMRRTPAWKFGWVRLLPAAAAPAVYDGELPV